MIRPVDVPGAPSIPGLSFRMFEPASDYPAMIGVLNAVGEAGKLGPAFNVARIKRDDASADGFDPGSSRFVAEIDGRMVGVATVHRCTLADGTVLTTIHSIY